MLEATTEDSQLSVLRSALPGRYRFWVPALYRSEAMKSVLEDNLAQKGSRQVVANPVTATLLVRSERKIDRLREEIDAVVCAFACAQKADVVALTKRGRDKPLHLAFSQPAGTAVAERCERKLSALSLRERLLRRANEANAPTSEQATELWHALGVERVSELLQSSCTAGIDGEQAMARLRRFGSNVVAPAQQRSRILIFVGQFKEWPVALLAGSAVISALTGGIAEAAAILGVVLLNGVIGYFTESKAEQAIASLTRHVVSDATTLRGGIWNGVPFERLVPGDVIELRPGSVVAVDARLLAVDNLTIDESALTGESMPVRKSCAPIADSRLPLGDRRNMVYRGTLVTGGSGVALTVATGLATEVGRLQSLVGDVERPETPMQRQLRELGQRTIVLASAVCGGVFAIGLVRGHSLTVMLRSAISLAVAAVPEGLPTVAITTLAIGIRKMRERDVIVRRLDAIETLGAVQVLCFDKTGTITENRMEVVAAATAESFYRVSGGRLRVGQETVEPLRVRPLERMLHAATLCSEVGVVDNGDQSFSLRGSSTESALVQFAMDAGLEIESLRQRYPKRRTEHRTEERPIMATLHETAERRGYLVMVKGSPLEVLDVCQTRLCSDGLVELSIDERRTIRRQNERMAGEALRVLGLAYAEHEEPPTELIDGRLTWLGMAGIADPPRAGLPELFRKFRLAGVRSIMITGDQSATAYAVAKQIGLQSDEELQIIDSTELDQVEPEILTELVQRVHVFSRVSPGHKLRIVQALQRAGLVVAMTGDGINDGPALKAADIGIAMGAGGSDVAREVSDIVLERDDLAVMLEAIEHGRVTYDDIKKAVRFILATNMSEILLTLCSVAAGVGEGLTPMQLLWINIVSDIFPELALAMQPPEHEVLERSPRDPSSKMFDHEEFGQMTTEGAVLTLGALGAYGYGLARYGRGPQAGALSFLTLTSAQLLHAFSTRSENHTVFERNSTPPNPYIPASVLGGIGLTVLTQVMPGLRRVIGSGRLAPLDWAVAAGGAILPLLANDTIKAVRLAQRRGEAPLPSHSANVEAG